MCSKPELLDRPSANGCNVAERRGTSMSSRSTPSRPTVKRIRESPTGNTPKQSQKQQSLYTAVSRAPLPRRQLSFSEGETTKQSKSQRAERVSVQEWTTDEDIALVGFILSHGCSWPGTKLPQFWERAARHVQQICGAQRRTSECMMCIELFLLYQGVHDYG